MKWRCCVKVPETGIRPATCGQGELSTEGWARRSKAVAASKTAIYRHDSASRARSRTKIHHWSLEFEGGRYSGTQMARRRSRANVIWEMSVKGTRQWEITEATC